MSPSSSRSCSRRSAATTRARTRLVRSLGAAFCLLSFASASTACATILDFQDAKDLLTDDGSSTSASPTSATLDGAPSGRDDSSEGAPSETDGGRGVDAAPDVIEEDVVVSPPPNSCSGGRCVLDVPDGWQGPLEMFRTSSGSLAGAPPCSGDYSVSVYSGYADPIAPAAQCTCSCDVPAGATCGKPVVTYYRDKECSQTCSSAASQSFSTNACTELSSSLYCTSLRMTITQPVASGGSCAVVAATQVPPASWSSAVRLCGMGMAATQSTCDAGNVCAPTTTPAFAPSNACIARSGTFACPAGYPSHHVFHASASDTRTCSACSCGSASGVACSGTFSGFNASGPNAGGKCVQPTSTASLPVTCATVGSLDSAVVSVTPNGGSCPATGGAPIGSFDPGPETTVCCEH